MKEFMKEYTNLLNQDIYISKEMFDEILYKYDLDITDDKNALTICSNLNYSIENHNQFFIEKRLKQYKEYFDEMFYLIDPNIVLDTEQRKIILEEERNSLIIAGAGSGKTTTMAAKVKYLVDKKAMNPKEILLLAFTNQATLELKDRIHDKFGIDADIMTFHKLGLKIIKSTFSKSFEIMHNNELECIIEDYLFNYAFQNKDYLKSIVKSFQSQINFTNKVYKYQNFDEYYYHYIHQLYINNICHIKKFNEEKIKNHLKVLKSIEGNSYNKIDEVLISNYLYISNIPYQYSYGEFSIFDTTLDDYQNHWNRYRHFRLDDGLFTSLTDMLKWLFQAKNFTHHIKQFNQFHEEKSQKEIFYTIMLNSKEELYQDFVILVKSFITKFKNKGLGYDDFNNIIPKNPKLTNQLKIMKDIYQFYETYKNLNHKIDFQDMIELAYQNIHKMKFEYKYIIIDEYQDISFQRHKLIKKISDIFKPNILAVGDDFQAIFSFSGSEVKLFTDFYSMMGYAKINKITKTYRNSQELIDIAGSFVMKNEAQIKKKLSSYKHIDKPVVVMYYQNNKSEILYKILQKIKKEHENSKILLLGRYKCDILSVMDGHYFKKIEDCYFCPSLNQKFDFMTIHAAKGLGYDEVVILNVVNSKMGFPSQIEDDDVINILNGKAGFSFLEERRLFYVALTRTKNKVYILCPSEDSKKSVFMKEIIGNDNVLEISDI